MSDIDTQDRDGVGRTLTRKLEDDLGDLSGFRTRIHKEPGRVVMLRTKGGNPEVTEKRDVPEGCVKGPLVEIAFKYANPSALSGYRRWYGEPDPAIGAQEKVIKYEWSSDGLLCMESRKLQKICFTDGNAQTVDFLFAERPEDDNIPAEALPEVSAAAAGSTARFKFIEGKYTSREWYNSELANIGWAFSGPTIAGDPTPEPASAVKFFIQRLRSITFSVSDTQGKVRSAMVKWIFLNPAEVERGVGAITTACTNQNAREVSFNNRHFFTPNTDGNMSNLTMSVGIDQPPAFAGGPSFSVEFKKPGSFIAAVDPEGATGNQRPADVARAIDLCQFSAFGNPYHGLYWKTGTSAAVLYRDSARESDWGFSPDTYYSFGLSIGGGDGFTHKYYNVRDKDPTLEDNQVSTGVEGQGVLYPDALLVGGAWYVKDADINGWGQLQYDEFLYKDPAGTVWVVQYEITSTARMYDTSAGLGVDHALVTVVIRLKRRYGILGTEFSGLIPAANTINRTITTLTFVDNGAWNIGAGFIMYLFRQYAFTCAPDAKTVMCQSRYMGEGSSMYALRGVKLFSMSGVGAVKADASEGIQIGDGITVSVADFEIPKPVIAGPLRAETLDLYHSNGQWNYLSATFVNKNTGGGFYDRGATIYRNGDIVTGQFSSLSNLTPYTVIPVFHCPVRMVEASSDLPPPYWKPLGWTVIRQDDTSSFNTGLVVRDSVITVNQADMHQYLHTDTFVYSAKIGWAYDYRTKELITTPFDTTAYFI